MKDEISNPNEESPSDMEGRAERLCARAGFVIAVSDFIRISGFIIRN